MGCCSICTYWTSRPRVDPCFFGHRHRYTDLLDIVAVLPSCQVLACVFLPKFGKRMYETDMTKFEKVLRAKSPSDKGALVPAPSKLS